MDTLADALPKEIERVTAKRDRWIQMAEEHPQMASGMRVSIQIMLHEIEQAIRVSASGDTVEMIRSLESLRGYSDDD